MFVYYLIRSRMPNWRLWKYEISLLHFAGYTQGRWKYGKLCRSANAFIHWRACSALLTWRCYTDKIDLSPRVFLSFVDFYTEETCELIFDSVSLSSFQIFHQLSNQLFEHYGIHMIINSLSYGVTRPPKPHLTSLSLWGWEDGDPLPPRAFSKLTYTCFASKRGWNIQYCVTCNTFHHSKYRACIFNSSTFCLVILC